MGHIIKSRGHVEPATVFNLRAGAQALERQARQRLDQASSDAAAVAEDARARGHAEGLAAAREEALAEATGILIAARLEAERLRQEARATALPLARRMAEKIIGHAVRDDPAVMAAVVERALAESRARTGAVTIRLAPEDLAGVAQRAQALAAHAGAAVALKFVADPAVESGGCIVETAAGRVDARLSRQLDALQAAIAAASAGGRGAPAP